MTVTPEPPENQGKLRLITIFFYLLIFLLTLPLLFVFIVTFTNIFYDRSAMTWSRFFSSIFCSGPFLLVIFFCLFFQFLRDWEGTKFGPPFRTRDWEARREEEEKKKAEDMKDHRPWLVLFFYFLAYLGIWGLGFRPWALLFFIPGVIMFMSWQLDPNTDACFDEEKRKEIRLFRTWAVALFILPALVVPARPDVESFPVLFAIAFVAALPGAASGHAEINERVNNPVPEKVEELQKESEFEKLIHKLTHNWGLYDEIFPVLETMAAQGHLREFIEDQGIERYINRLTGSIGGYPTRLVILSRLGAQEEIISRLEMVAHYPLRVLRYNVCVVLGHIGDEKQLPLLEELTRDRTRVVNIGTFLGDRSFSSSVRDMARAAIASIRKREEDEHER